MGTFPIATFALDIVPLGTLLLGPCLDPISLGMVPKGCCLRHRVYRGLRTRCIGIVPKVHSPVGYFTALSLDALLSGMNSTVA